MAEEKSNSPSRIEKTAQSVASKKMGAALGKRIAGSAVAKAIGSTLGSSLGSIVPLVGNVLGGLIGGALAGSLAKALKQTGKTIAALPAAIGSLGAQIGGLIAISLNQAIGTVFSALFAGVGILTLLTIFILFIINSGAYVVPPGSDLNESSGGLIFSNERVGCFLFTGAWSPEDLQKENTAAQTIMSFERYAQKLCEGGDITVEYNSSDPGYGGITFSQERKIIIYHQGVTAYGVASATYTLAHESGHVYDRWNGATGSFIKNAGIVQELPLIQIQRQDDVDNDGDIDTYNVTYQEGICSYPLDALDDRPGLQVPPFENFAESVALIIAGSNAQSGYRNLACMGGPFENAYPNTYNYVLSNYF